ncbi:MAG: hypothetical protein WCL16_11335 [bacterium]
MAAANRVLIGWAGRDITPDRPVNLLGQFHLRISKGVQDPVTITALSVASGAEAFIWVSCDLCEVSVGVLEQCREKLKRKLPEFPPEKLIINTTHTHTAPDLPGFWYPPVPSGVMTPAEYSDFFSDRVADAAAESWKARKPGAVAWGYGYAVAGHNRRVVYFDDLSQRPGYTELSGMKTEKHARMYGDTKDPQFSGLEGCVDHSVNLLFTFDENKSLTGVVYNLPCTSQETENIEYVSADFWHEVRMELRQRHGQNLFVLPQCAPAGDLSPHPMYNKDAEQRMLQLKHRTSRQEIAQRLANAFDEIYTWARNDLREELQLAHSIRAISLTRRLISEQEYLHTKAALAALEKILPVTATDAATRAYNEKDDVCFSRKFRCLRILARYEEQKHHPDHQMELHVIRLGDIVFATNSFELFLDYGLRMIGRSPAVQTFLVQLTAGGSPSYLATAKAEAGESYSACLYCNEVNSQGGQQLVEQTVKTMNELWA